MRKYFLIIFLLLPGLLMANPVKADTNEYCICDYQEKLSGGGCGEDSITVAIKATSQGLEDCGKTFENK
ncbi:hypothetical protein KJ785_04010, partial [Patescibacteria group bacterium]|nr:hypothetical protein [Patescibacteria group bacterium]